MLTSWAPSAVSFMTSQARMLTPGSPSERRRNTSNVITAGDWAVRLRDWTALMSSVVRASVSARFDALDRAIGGDWLHEIKHDGFRIMARRDAAGVRLLTRNGYDFAGRFPLAAAAV